MQVSSVRVDKQGPYRRLLLVSAFALVILFAYSNSFQSGFVFDNSPLILQDERIRAATSVNLGLILNQEYWYNHTPTGLYRPLTTLSYLFNYAILDNTDHPAGYHWINFALHAANIVMVYLVALLVLRKPVPAFAVAAAWALHPIGAESVTNIVGRADLLAAFGVLGGLLCHVQAAAAAGRRKLVWLCALIAVSAVGLFSKESAVVLLAVMAIYDFTFHTTPWRARLSWPRRRPWPSSWVGDSSGFGASCVVKKCYGFPRAF